LVSLAVARAICALIDAVRRDTANRGKSAASSPPPPPTPLGAVVVSGPPATGAPPLGASLGVPSACDAVSSTIPGTPPRLPPPPPSSSSTSNCVRAGAPLSLGAVGGGLVTLLLAAETELLLGPLLPLLLLFGPLPDLPDCALDRLEITDAGLDVLLLPCRPAPAVRTSSADAAARPPFPPPPPLRALLGVPPWRVPAPLPGCALLPLLLRAELAVESPSVEVDRCRVPPLLAGRLLPAAFGVFRFTGSGGDPSCFPSRLEPRARVDFPGEGMADCVPSPELPDLRPLK
jgi:hypothetical protein